MEIPPYVFPSAGDFCYRHRLVFAAVDEDFKPDGSASEPDDE